METWDPVPPVFDENHWYVVDFPRTISCSNGDDKNVYDYSDYGSDLPEPHKVDIEEWSLSCPWCNEETEIGTKRPYEIVAGTQYYIVVYFSVNLHDTPFGMRFEPELEYVGGENVDWCLLICVETETP